MPIHNPDLPAPTPKPSNESEVVRAANRYLAALISRDREQMDLAGREWDEVTKKLDEKHGGEKDFLER